METRTGRIVVGYDGSEPADAALDWAVDQARRYRHPITVISIADHAGMLPGLYGPTDWPALFQKEAEDMAATGVERIRRSAATIDVSSEASVGHVAGTLVAASRTADRLVVGTRGHGPLSGTLLGSVSLTVIAHAHCPVIVVRGESTAPGPECPVLVGVDDSSGAHAALFHAADRAAEACAPLTIATIYRPVSARVWNASGYFDARTVEVVDLDAMARKAAENVTAAAARLVQEQHPMLKIQELVVSGSAAQELTAAATDCGLLVVGSRGHGGFTGLLLGSVSRRVLHSAPLPGGGRAGRHG